MLNYPRHFGLLACMVAVLAVTHRWAPDLGAMAWCGIYGALHSSALIVTLRAAAPPPRRGGFVVVAAAMSMSVVAASRLAGQAGVGWSGLAKAAALLAFASGTGAAAYSLLIRGWFGVPLAAAKIVSITLGCIVAALAVLASRLYLHGGTLWFAAAWWFAFSAGLWYFEPAAQARKTRAPGG
jgi:hypothetical protein